MLVLCFGGWVSCFACLCVFASFTLVRYLITQFCFSLGDFFCFLLFAFLPGLYYWWWESDFCLTVTSLSNLSFLPDNFQNFVFVHECCSFITVCLRWDFTFSSPFFNFSTVSNSLSLSALFWLVSSGNFSNLFIHSLVMSSQLLKLCLKVPSHPWQYFSFLKLATFLFFIFSGFSILFHYLHFYGFYHFSTVNILNTLTLKYFSSWVYYFCFLGNQFFHFLYLLTISHGVVSSVFSYIFSSPYLPLGFFCPNLTRAGPGLLSPPLEDVSWMPQQGSEGFTGSRPVHLVFSSCY